MKPADVQALIEEARRGWEWAKDQDDVIVAQWARDHADAILQGAGRRGKPCYCCTQGCDPACRCWGPSDNVAEDVS